MATGKYNQLEIHFSLCSPRSIFSFSKWQQCKVCLKLRIVHSLLHFRTFPWVANKQENANRVTLGGSITCFLSLGFSQRTPRTTNHIACSQKATITNIAPACSNGSKEIEPLVHTLSHLHQALLCMLQRHFSEIPQISCHYHVEPLFLVLRNWTV